MDDGISRITGHIEHLQIGPLGQGILCNLSPVHSGHNDIREKKINLFIGVIDDLVAASPPSAVLTAFFNSRRHLQNHDRRCAATSMKIGTPIMPVTMRQKTN
jgi:hypothetical protein